MYPKTQKYCPGHSEKLASTSWGTGTGSTAHCTHPTEAWLGLAPSHLNFCRVRLLSASSSGRISARPCQDLAAAFCPSSGEPRRLASRGSVRPGAACSPQALPAGQQELSQLLPTLQVVDPLLLGSSEGRGRGAVWESTLSILYARRYCHSSSSLTTC